MMQVTKAAQYAFRALEVLAQEEVVRSAGELAKRCDIPPSYALKVMNALTRAGIVATRRGCEGGYSLAVEPDELELLTVLNACDGPSEGREVPIPGPADKAIREAFDAFRRTLHDLTLADL